MPSGTLYVVATPIGNLEDLTFRALRILREVDLIAAEDTRRTAKLLAHYDIRKPMVSLREHNEVRETPRLVERLGRGERIALVSDAGTPGIADPGAGLVKATRAAGLSVVPIPGASAVTTALSVSGIAETEFVFMGFPPATGSARRAWFDRLAQEARTIVFFEAPHRIERTMEEIAAILVDRPIQINRELTKIHEELVDKPNDGMFSVAGEFVVVVGPRRHAVSGTDQAITASDLMGRLTECPNISESEVIELVSLKSGQPAREVRKMLKKLRYSVKQQMRSDG